VRLVITLMSANFETVLTLCIGVLTEDEQFREEKGVIIKEISMLDGPPGEGQPSQNSHVW